MRSTIAIPAAAARNANSGDRIRFVGSKGGAGVWQRIISEMPPHRFYVEPFVGRGVIALNKKPARSTIVIDSDSEAPGFRISGTTRICGDAISTLEKLRSQMDKSWLVYADPPYLGSVRADPSRRYYKHEMRSPEAHAALLACLRSLPCLVMLSGYASALYASTLADWRTVEIPTITRGGKRATEVLWLNFPEPFAFHDTRFLGDNFRERERIKRKKLRWKSRLAGMSRLDRAAVLDAISELASS